MRIFFKSLVFVFSFIVLVYFLSFLAFGGSKLFLFPFSFDTIFGVFLVSVLLKYLIYILIFFVFFRLFGIYITPLRNFKIVISILIILSIAVYFIENPLRKWQIANLVVSDFLDRKYVCGPTELTGYTSQSCYISFAIKNKSVDEVVNVINSRLISAGYESDNYVLNGDFPSTTYTSITDPLVINRIKQGEKITDLYRKKDENQQTLNTDTIKFLIDPAYSQGKIIIRD